MYSNLPFTGAPLAYIAIAIIFITAGSITRFLARFEAKKGVKQDES